ncbi:MAG: LysM peptidoglycan-binding domain-containing protein [Gammaproteobacteria bacterium]|nr:LysM peptidoglycan-binding domain-containing protein [Gammaproteobacteria bacterium]
MIAKSDLFILVTASAVLSFGVFRWNQNTQAVDAITIPASSRSVAAAPVPETAATVPTAAVVTPTNDTNAAQVLNSTTANNGTNALDTNTIEVAEPVVVTEAVVQQPSYANHVVTRGESLSIIANRYGTSVQALRDLNGITGSTILIGQNIRYPVDQ